MRRASHSLTIGLTLWVAASSAHALGFGRVSSSTVLGQPLNFAAIIRLAPDESLTSECVFAEVFAGENRLVQQLVQVQVEPAPDVFERRVRVRTTTSIDEPVVTVNLTVGCQGRSTRKFVAFVDPPELMLAQAGGVGHAVAQVPPPANGMASPPAAMAAPAPAAGGGAAAATRATPEPQQPEAAAPRPVQRRTGAPRASQRPTSANVAAAPKPRRTPSTGTAAPRAAAGPVSRLKLEAAPPILTARAPDPSTAVPAANPIAPAPVPPAASAAQPGEPARTPAEVAAAESLVLERARLQALEESLKRVRDETQAAQKTLAALQLRIKEAESQRYANPLVYALAAISALLALAVGGLWWRQVRAQREAKWWGTVAPSMAASSELQESTTDDSMNSRFAPSSAPAELSKPSAKVMVAPEPAKAVWADSRQTEPASDLMPEPRRDLSVEELIDLEQQAEFFVVLGQDDAAIDLLMGHVRSTGGISPLPYLKLLEIYRRRGDRSAYERIRERFNRRFNAYAPDWDADLQQGRSLEDYPATIARLEALWVMPARVMETLEASLFRRDETEEAFDLPAYRELLFLYAVARDFAHRADDSSAVDLLLPMDSDAPHVPVSRLVASLPGSLERSNLGRPGQPEKPPASEPSGRVTESGGLSLELGPLDMPDEPGKPPSPSRR